MTLKERILKWLGIGDLLEQQATLHAEALQAHAEQHAESLRVALLALFEKQQAALVDALQAARTDMREEYVQRLGLMMDASITASERIAKMVASQGDSNLKEYIDGVFSAFEVTAPMEIN